VSARQPEFTLIGTDEITGERYARSAPDADACFRRNICASMDVWGSTPHQTADACGIDRVEFEQFIAGRRGANLEWVTRLAAYTGFSPAQALVPQTANARTNALAHLELIASGDDLVSMLETLIVAKRSGLLPDMLSALRSMSDVALKTEGENPAHVRALVRQIAGAR
jgi:hypothetical protein